MNVVRVMYVMHRTVSAVEVFLPRLRADIRIRSGKIGEATMVYCVAGVDVRVSIHNVHENGGSILYWGFLFVLAAPLPRPAGLVFLGLAARGFLK